MPESLDLAKSPGAAGLAGDGIKAISGSTISVFSEPDDFALAMREDGVVGLLAIDPGPFRARLTQVTLHRLHLSTAEEYGSRVAFVTVPTETLLVCWPVGDGTATIWGGARMGAEELLTIGPGERVHARTDGPSRSASIRLPPAQLARYGRALTGAEFPIPPGACRWLPAASAGAQLWQLHAAIVRLAAIRPEAIADAQAAHGLEQQLLHALVECLAPAAAHRETPADQRDRDLLARFEELLEAGSTGAMAELCAALGVPDRLLRECCKTQLGIGPGDYRRRRAMHRVNCALRSGDRNATTVATIAGQYGFRDLGRFARYYRAIYRELPSVTLRRSASSGLAELALARPRVKGR